MKRNVDELGRIVLPAEYRNALNIKAKDEVRLLLEPDRITVQKFVSSCYFCNSTDHLVRLGSEAICKSCMRKLLNPDSDSREE